MRFLANLVAALGLLALLAGPVGATSCLSWYGNQCTWWEPSLPPGARWCAQGERPDARSAMFWTGVSNYYCMVMPIAYHRVGGTKIPDLWRYGWASPYNTISAMELGASVYGYTCSDENYGGAATWWPAGSASSQMAPFTVGSVELAY